MRAGLAGQWSVKRRRNTSQHRAQFVGPRRSASLGGIREAKSACVALRNEAQGN